MPKECQKIKKAVHKLTEELQLKSFILYSSHQSRRAPVVSVP